MKSISLKAEQTQQPVLPRAYLKVTILSASTSGLLPDSQVYEVLGGQRPRRPLFVFVRSSFEPLFLLTAYLLSFSAYVNVIFFKH
jgi:hypothetical protein